MKYKIILKISWVSIGFIFLVLLFIILNSYAQTSRFEKTFRTASGTLLTGATIYIVNQLTGDSLKLNEDAIHDGVYYRNNVSYGHYKIYVNTILRQQNYYFGTIRQKDFIDAVDPNGDNQINGVNSVHGSALQDSTVSIPKFTTAAINYIGSGGSVTNNPDDNSIINIGPISLGVNPSWLDTAQTQADDIGIQKISNKFSIKNSGITWEKLSNSLQTIIGGGLYNYQDASINEVFQMHFRWMDYQHDQYYNPSTFLYDFDYDITNSNYCRDRTALIEYMKSLWYRHAATQKDIYFHKLVVLTDELLDSVSTTPHNITSGRNCFTININPDADFKNFAYQDCMFARILYYIYSQDNSTYSHYLDSLKNFIDVSYSYINKDPTGLDGWAYAYTWNDEEVDSTTRINTCSPFLPLYATMKKNNITTTDITSIAVYDTLMDSIYTSIMCAWYDTTISSVHYGGWKLRPYLSNIWANIDYRYNVPIAYNMIETSLILNNTEWQGGFVDTIKALINFQTQVDNYYTENFKYYVTGNSFLFKWGKENNSDYDFIKRVNATLTSLYNWFAYCGNNLNVRSIGVSQRSGDSWFYGYVSPFVKWYNSSTFMEDYDSYTRDTWSANATTFPYFPGEVSSNKYGIGMLNTPNYVYYRTADSSPNCPDTSTWNFNSITKVINYTYPVQANGLTYEIKHKLGTPYMKVIPSISDSIWIMADKPGDAAGDSVYIFYYNLNSELDTLKNTTLSAGDSILIKGNLGIFVNTVQKASPSQGKRGIGFICSNSNLYLKASYVTDANYKIYVTSSATMIDSCMFFAINHEQGNLFNYLENNWNHTFYFVEDILYTVKKIWDNGFNYEGILEDKNQ